DVSCGLAAANSSSSTGPINLVVGRGGRSFGPARLRARGTWLQPALSGQLRPQSTIAGLVVNERAPLSVAARTAARAVTEPVKGIPTVPAILEGVIGRRTPEPISYRWRQLCGPGPCARVRWASATSGPVLDGQQPTAS